MKKRRVKPNIRVASGLKIIDLSLGREKLALNCKYRGVCLAHSKNCYTCPRRRGVYYLPRKSHTIFHAPLEDFHVSGGYQSPDHIRKV